jgi:hypothetical protein
MVGHTPRNLSSGAGPCFQHTENAGALPFSRSLREGGALHRTANGDVGWLLLRPAFIFDRKIALKRA